MHLVTLCRSSLPAPSARSKYFRFMIIVFCKTEPIYRIFVSQFSGLWRFRRLLRWNARAAHLLARNAVTCVSAFASTGCSQINHQKRGRIYGRELARLQNACLHHFAANNHRKGRATHRTPQALWPLPTLKKSINARAHSAASAEGAVAPDSHAVRTHS